MLRSRLFSAVILIGGSLVFVGLDAWAYNFACPGIWMLPLGFYLIYGSAVETTAMVARSPFGSVSWPALIACAGIMAAGMVPVVWPLMVSSGIIQGQVEFHSLTLASAALALVFCFVWFFFTFQAGQGVLVRCVLAGWIACYFGICFSMAIAVRLTGDPGWGLYFLIGIIAITKFSDSGAYFVGRSLGRTKLCKHVSPNKTVEGLFGGLLFAFIAACIYFGLIAPRVFGRENLYFTWLGLLVVSASLTVAGLAGDLLQSAFKREMGVKDSGRLLPGLGGLWDVTDSLLPAVVVGYVLARAGVVAGPGQ